MNKIEIKYGTSKGRDTYGYTTVNLYHNGTRKGSCNGGGYDMTGEVLGDFILKEFYEELKKLHSDKFHGLSFYNTKTKKRQKTYTGEHVKIFVDGACGKNSMETILEKIGYDLVFMTETRNTKIYSLSKK